MMNQKRGVSKCPPILPAAASNQYGLNTSLRLQPLRKPSSQQNLQGSKPLQRSGHYPASTGSQQQKRFQERAVPLKPSHDVSVTNLVNIKPTSGKRYNRPKSSYGLRSGRGERSVARPPEERPSSRRGRCSTEDFVGGYEGRERPCTSRGRRGQQSSTSPLFDQPADVVRPTTSRGRQKSRSERELSEENSLVKSVDYLSIETGEEFHEGEELIEGNTNNNAGHDDSMASLEEFRLRSARLSRTDPVLMSSVPSTPRSGPVTPNQFFPPGPPDGPPPDSAQYRSARRRRFSTKSSHDSGFQDLPSPASRPQSSLSQYSVLPSISSTNTPSKTQEGSRFQSPRNSITLPPEPSENEPSVTLGIKCLNGLRIQRTFSLSNTLQDVINFAAVASSLDFSCCYLVSPMPRKIFSDLQMTLADSGIQNRTLLHVEED